MNTIKETFLKAWLILSSPTKAWQQITSDKTENSLSALRFFYTLLLIGVGATFFGSLLYKSGFHFVGALLKSIIVGISLYGGFWGIYFLLLEALKKYIRIIPDKQTCLQLVIYSYTAILIIDIITALVPSFFFLKIINLYTVYLVWEGVGLLFDFEEKNRGNLVLSLSISMIVFPYIIERILFYLLPTANF
jgi:hypothetical protein